MSLAEDRRSLAAWAAAAAALLVLLMWARGPDPVWLAIAAVAAAVSAVLGWRRADRTPRRLMFAGLAVIGFGIAAGVVAQRQLFGIETDWPAERALRTRRLADRLGQEVGGLAEQARVAANLTAAAAAGRPDSSLDAALAGVLERTRVDGVMVFTDRGELVSWAGEHRGQIPDTVRSGGPEGYFAERPLYSYLYRTAAVKDTRMHAVAAVLLETAAPQEGVAQAISFAAHTDVPALFRSGGASGEDVAWSLVVEGDTVVSARVDAPSQSEAMQATGTGAARLVFVLAAIAGILLLVSWLREPDLSGRPLLRPAPLLVAAAAFLVAPLGRIFGSSPAFSVLEFLMPGPRQVTLGVLFAVGLPLAALAATAIRPPRRERDSDAGLSLAFGVAALAAILVVAIRVIEYSTTTSLLRGGNTLWFGLQATAVLLLTSAAALLLPGPVLRNREPPIRRAWLVLAASLLSAAVLGVAVQTRLDIARGMAPAAAALWAVPYALLGFAFRDPRFGRSGLPRWLAAGFLAASAVLPQLWGGHIGARLRAANEDVSSLGETPGILGYLLYQFADEAEVRYAGGETGAQLVYRTWVASGLAREPYPVRVILWSTAGVSETELSLGGAHGSPISKEAMRQHILDTLAQSRGDTVTTTGTQTGVPDVIGILVKVLDRQHVLSAQVEPRVSLRRVGVLAPYLGGGTDPDISLNLIRARASDAEPTETHWSRVPEGWRGEAMIRYPDGLFKANVTLRATPLTMRLARAALLIAFDLALLALLWLVGHLAQGLRIVHREGVPWVHTLRARITAALFAFFIVPTAVFGWLAYRGLSAVVTQASTGAASSAAQQAAVEWPQVNGDLTELAQHAGTDVLYYLGGELADVSGSEALALGIYNAWMEPHTFRVFERGEESAATESGRIGDQEYVTAYHTLQPAGTLAVPMGIAAGETAQRQRDVAHLVLLAAVIGATLSILLSIVVGRALAGPIGLLQRAAATVGSGRLSVRLPEPKSDEFGQLFSSFNRMVRQLRRARAREVRTARVLAWGEMARQVAHEIKNPLTPIRLAVQHLRRAWRDRRGDFGELLDENVDQVLVEIDRLNEIARAFSRYGAPRDEAGPLRAVDVARVVREALTLYRAGETGIRYIDRLEPSLPAVRARVDEMREVLLNLLENARDAVDGEGEVVVAGRAADGVVEIEVSDSGPGIGEDLIPRIFEPHFSTRSSGTGLGLAIVRRLVESWGGEVDASSDAERGTTLRLRIPVVEESGDEPVEASSPEPQAPGDDAPGAEAGGDDTETAG